MAATALKSGRSTRTEQQTTEPASGRLHTAYLNCTDDIVKALKLFRDQRAPVTVNFEGQPTSYVGKLLDASVDDFLLEDLQPRNGLSLMRPGTEFSLSSRTQGIYIHSGINRVIAVESERGVPFFRIALPNTLLYQQRRRNARFRLPARVTASHATISLERHSPESKDEPVCLEGRIVDISAGGCRCELVTPVVLDLERNEPVTCNIEISEQLSLRADGAIRHSSFDAKRRVMTCGIELLEMQVTDRRRLERFIESIRRNDHRA